MQLNYFSMTFFYNDTATTEIYPLSLHDALPIYLVARSRFDQHLRRTADFERRQRRERRVRAYGGGAEADYELRAPVAHDALDSTAIRARSCAMSAAIASAAEHVTNEMESPGPS